MKRFPFLWIALSPIAFGVFIPVAVFFVLGFNLKEDGAVMGLMYLAYIILWSALDSKFNKDE